MICWNNLIDIMIKLWYNVTIIFFLFLLSVFFLSCYFFLFLAKITRISILNNPIIIIIIVIFHVVWFCSVLFFFGVLYVWLRKNKHQLRCCCRRRFFLVFGWCVCVYTWNYNPIIVAEINRIHWMTIPKNTRSIRLYRQFYCSI